MLYDPHTSLKYIQAAYVPKAGFPGTLAPGINFKEDCPFESLPKKILHPWPAMQQIQWCVISDTVTVTVILPS
jgi:hypothetical protein